jgi:hypothetical protein
MLTRSRTTRDLFPRVARRAAALAALLALLASAAPLAPVAHAQKKNGKRPTVGVLEVSTAPGGNPLFIDDAPAGPTTENMRVIELTPGPHKIEIVFPNGTRWSHVVNTIAGRKDCIALTYRPRSIDIPPITQSPCPYPVKISAPATVADGDQITFSADVPYTGQSALNYTWTVSPPTATITSGAGTPTITVDSTGSGRRVTAILVVDDGSGDRACRQTAQASTGILAAAVIPINPKRFDEFPSVAYDDDKARLDNLAIELQNSPGSTGYVIAYAGRGRRAGHADRMGRRALDYLVTTRGIDSGRVVFINGGTRERDTYELWIVPQGAEPPRPTPTTLN